MIINFNTDVLGFDLETQGDLAEYALQPWRARDGLARVSAVAFTRGETSNGVLYPDPKAIRSVLTAAIDKGLYVCGWNITFDVAWVIALGMEDLAFKVKWLDAMLLWRHLDVEPEGDDIPRNKRRSYSLETAMYTFFPEHADFKEFKDFQTQDAEQLKRLLYRCKEDTRWAVVLAEKFWNQLNHRQQVAAILESQCIPQMAWANVNGIWSSMDHAVNLQAKLEADGAAAQAALQTTCPEIVFVESGLTPKQLKDLKAGQPDKLFINLGSPIQLATLLFDHWELPVLKQTKGTEKNPEGNRSTDKYVLYELAFKDPRAKLLKEIREAKNNCTKYAVATQNSLLYNGDGYIRPQARVFGTYCVPGSVEVLTRSGWVRLHDWLGGDIVQAHIDGRLEFLHADKFVGEAVDEWVSIDHANLKCLFTHNHTIPYLSQKYKKWSTTKAIDMMRHQGSTFDLPVSGKLINLAGQYTDLQMRVMCMAQADGWFSERGFLKFTFKKERKIARSIDLLNAAGINHRVRSWPSYPDRVEIIIPKKSLPAWLSPSCKLLGAWLFDTTPEGLQAFVDEVVHWDGNINQDDGVDYSSSIRINADWVNTIAHLVGLKSALQSNICKGVSVTHMSSINQRAIRTIRTSRHVSEIRTDRPVQSYCTITQTGFWLARSNGSIFITGNSGRMTYASGQRKNKEGKIVEEVDGGE